MTSTDYNLTALFYPREAGLQLLPLGLPQGVAVAKRRRKLIKLLACDLSFP